MIDIIKAWFERHFSDPQAVILVVFLLLGGVLILYWGEVLTPVLAGIVIAYVLEGMVRKLMHLGIPRPVAFSISYLFFIASLALFIIGLVPLATGLIGWCPPYHLLGISTCGKCETETKGGAQEQ